MSQFTFKRMPPARESAERETAHRESDAPGPGFVPVPGLLGGEGASLRRSTGTDVLGGSAVPDTVERELRSRRGRGAPLPSEIAGPLGAHFGTDLSDVRVHADERAGVLARSVEATAFTHGNDIYFAPGAYEPGGANGQRVLAHELSHVAAQRSGADRGSGGGLTVGRADDPAEAAADRSADRALAALRRTPAGPGSAPAGSAAQRHDPDRDVVPAGADELRRKWPWQSKSKGTAPSTDSAGPSTDAPVAASEYPKTATIGSEQVQVNSAAEEQEADRIVTDLKKTYGLDLSSATTITGIKKQYKNVPSSVTDLLQASVWTMLELRALSEAATYYAPILGSQRDESTLAASVQGVTTVGKLKNAIDSNRATGELDTSTLGEYFSGEKNLGLFDAGTNYQDKNFVRKGSKKTDVQTSLTATAIHEMAHALVAPLQLSNFVNAIDYWADRNTKSGKWFVEKPPTSYGKTNANEDLCESVALFFINRATLKKKCPKREAFIAKVVSGWKPEKKEELVTTAVSAPGTEPATVPTEEGAK